MATSTLKSEIRKQICDSKHSMRDLINTVKINDYLNAVFQPDEESIIMYGVNVRLKDDADIMPFIYFHAGTKYSASSVAGNITYTAPDFINSNHIKDIYFSCKIKGQKQIGEVSIISGHDALEGNNVSNVERIEELLNQSGSFLIQNIEALGFKKDSYCYVWIAGEDFDPESGGEKTLSNILAISNKQPIIENLRTKQIQIEEFLFLLKSKYLIEVDRKRKLAAEKSAKAAIMSRNMSHNLGSHVMAYLKQKLGSVPAILNKENKVLSNLYLYDDNELSKTTKESVEMPFLVGLGRFIGYLQERQDYIATIATDYIPYGAPVNMKDAIYDELNPDLRHLRHNTAESDKDQNLPFNVLLSYIAKSEGLSRENMEAHGSITGIETEHDILMGYICYGENDESEPHIFGFEPVYSVSSDPALEEMRKINFSLPGGLVGRQAIFSIVENLIRNAAKHGDTSKVKNLNILFDVIDGAQIKDGSAVRIRERLSDPEYRDLYVHASDINDLYLLTITDNLTYNPHLASNILASGLEEPYIDSGGQMTTGNKGIKEIRISSAWLRNDANETNYFRKNDAVDSKKKAPLVSIEVTPDKHLRYIIALHKNKRVAFINQGLDAKSLACFEFLKMVSPNDWYQYDTAKDFLKERKASFAYVIVGNAEQYTEIRPDYSNRVFIWQPEEGQKRIICELWEKISDAETRQKQTKDKDFCNSLQSKIMTVIYQLYTGIFDTKTPIYIWDSKTVNAQQGKKVFKEKESIVISDSDENENIAKYAYRTHHSTEKEFNTYYKDKKTKGKYAHIEAVDAITGDNSSDRLVRRESLNEEWYYSHLRALKKRIAVFDERLFRIIHNIDEKSLMSSGSGVIADVLKKVEENSITVAEVVQMINDREIFVSYNRRKEINEKFNSGKLTNTILSDTLSDISKHFTKQNTEGNHLSAFYNEKGVDVFTIIKERDREFAIVGCTEIAWENGTYKCTFDKIGRFYLNNENQIKIEFIQDGYQSRYDFITIHQGILDKIYEGYGIKQFCDENNRAKCLVTKELYTQFMRDSEMDIVVKNGEEFLPRFIIHSGRAKPTVDDMPQKLPFVQFAAIENAVKDCKYSLVQLLDYARYEDSESEA